MRRILITFLAFPKVNCRLGYSHRCRCLFLALACLVQDLKIFKMGLLGIPQERIAQRLGVSQDIVSNHLRKSSELKKATNDLLTKGFATNTIAEKLGLPLLTPRVDKMVISDK